LNKVVFFAAFSSALFGTAVPTVISKKIDDYHKMFRIGNDQPGEYLAKFSDSCRSDNGN
jgi:hypothetical protein